MLASPGMRAFSELFWAIAADVAVIFGLALDPNDTYTQAIILLSDGLNTHTASMATGRI